MTANSFAKKDGILRVHFIGHDDPPKSDAFLWEYNGTYYLIDGGVDTNDYALQYLLRIRRELLGGRPELIGDASCKLKITSMASHCHVDHIGALFASVFPSPYIEVDSFYVPPASQMDPHYNLKDTNGDEKYRPRLDAALREFQPQAKVITHAFGAENRFCFRMVEGDERSPLITVCPAYLDYGIGEKMAHLVDIYCDGDRDDRKIAILAVNNCSDWFHVRHGERTFLFTGDTTKKLPVPTEEMAGEMTDVYLPIFGQVDVVKYVHHGYARDAAAPDMMRFDPQYVVISARIGTGAKVIRHLFPESPVRLINSGEQTYVFSTDGEKLSVSPEA
ncbi:MAG: hypothetical protein IJW99_01600 [Clostridia bacterium]|nr:hypothetical protein [Clostridia bacterium]